MGHDLNPCDVQDRIAMVTLNRALGDGLMDRRHWSEQRAPAFTGRYEAGR